MNIKIVADSSANLPFFEGVPYASVPLKITTEEREFVDDGTLDCEDMMAFLSRYHGRSGSSCPGVGEWLEAFGEAEAVFTLAISRSMSGSHNAALQAKHAYEEAHPGRKVCCLDTLTTGPELILAAEKIRELSRKNLEFEQIRSEVKQYMKKTHMVFLLSSVSNLAKNGRVNPLVARAVGILNIRIAGQASDSGTFLQMHKSRGEKKGIASLFALMKEDGFRGGPVRINHVFNEASARILEDLILGEFPDTDVKITPAAGLCSFYAEQGGLMVGFEG